jgi:predicted metal-binding membrane protein
MMMSVVMMTMMTAMMTAMMTPMTAPICPYRVGGKRTEQHKGYAHQFRLFHINLQLVVIAMFSCRKS